MPMIHFHSARESQSIKIGNRFFHYMANFKYLQKASTVHKKIQKPIKFGGCLLLFNIEFFVYPSAIYKCKD